MTAVFRQVFSKCLIQHVKMQIMASEYIHTADNHGHAWVFLKEYQTLDDFYSTPFLSFPQNIKYKSPTSESNLASRFLQLNTHTVLLCRDTFQTFSFSGPISSALVCCGSAVLSWGLTSVSHDSWEPSLYFLSLLNLWKKMASRLSCLSVTTAMLCNHSGTSVQCKYKIIIQEKPSTFTSIMLRQFLSWGSPSSLVFCLMKNTIFGHTYLCHQCIYKTRQAVYLPLATAIGSVQMKMM